jgi:lipopolysaccharide/colanic/teichoic acid biosynthesis glycosyltransferase
MDSLGSAIFRQERVGLNGRIFRIIKFRTMHTQQNLRAPQITAGPDPRITHAGSFLRKYKLDELPQLFNVLAGDMSLVGPRPEVPRYVALYPDEVRKRVLSVLPGITDLASIEYRHESDILGQSDDPERTYVEKIMLEKLKYAERYVAEQSFFLDIKIIIRTLVALVS